MTAGALVLYSAVLLVPVGNDDGDEIVAGEIDGVTRDDVSAWAAEIMAGRTGGRVFVTEWQPGTVLRDGSVIYWAERFDTGVTGEMAADDSAVRWFGA